MMMNADCRRVRELMDSYISGELTVESNHDLLRHVERCESCRAELAGRERTRALLIESFGPAPDAGGMDARIMRAIDQHDRKWWRLAQYGGIAAAVMIAIGAAVWLSRPVDAAAFDDSVDDHIACALTYPPDFAYDGQRAEQHLDPPYRAILQAVSHTAGDYQLIDGHMCPYQGRNYAHLVYRRNGRPLSVFIETADRGRLPLTHETPRKGFVTVGESTGRHQVFVVGDHGEPPPGSVVDDLMNAALAYVRSLDR
ncbi:MAG TPA: zf-HC2 domain-containing protein [Vicinamibacterales bacterium]|nr:zf-HC2 domain-containing protein [Vicinamibacterales bacterium]